MKSRISVVLISLFLSSTPAYSQLLDRDKFARELPAIEEGSLKPENKKIICPFHRMMERAGLYDSSLKTQGALYVTVAKVTEVAKKFGCMISGCGTVATAVSGGQLATFSTIFGSVNMTALHKSIGISHECGLTFPKGSSVVTDAHRMETIRRLSARADANGNITLDDLNFVKEGICREQGVSNNLVGQVEVKLIYAFLGGQERGFIEVKDVERFFFAELPKTIAAPNVDFTSGL